MLALEALTRDGRDAWRSLRASRSFSAVVLCVLALGIGTSTAVFSVVDAVALRGLPFEGVDTLMGVSRVDPVRRTVEHAGFAAVDVRDYRQRQDVFQRLAAVPSGPLRVALPGDAPEDVFMTRSTADLFDVLGVRPQLGVIFTADHEHQGNHRVVLISDTLWRRRFGSSPDVVGKILTVGTIPREILGVMPPGFTYPIGTPSRADLWIPWVVPPGELERTNGRSGYVSMVGRLRPGVTSDQAQARMAQIAGSIATENPAWFKEDVRVRTLVDTIVGDDVRAWMLMLLGAVVCVMLIATVNVANMRLAHDASRRNDLVIRTALGASRWALFRRSLIENLAVAAAGATIGVLLAVWLTNLLRAWMPPEVPRASAITIDLRVLGAVAGSTVLLAVALAVGPAVRLLRRREHGIVFAERRLARSSQRPGLQGAFVVVQVALSIILLIGAGLFTFSFVRVLRVDLGFDPNGVAMFSVSPRLNLSTDQERRASETRARTMIRAALDTVRALPGVESAAALAGGLPLTESSTQAAVDIPGRQIAQDERMVEVRQASPEYLTVMRLSLVRGRWLSPDDSSGSEAVVVLNETAARRYFDQSDAVGAEMSLQLRRRRVVGVVRDTRLDGPELQTKPEAYLPLEQSEIYRAAIVMRTASDPRALLAPARAAVAPHAPGPAFVDWGTLDAIYDGLIVTRRFNMLLLSVFGVLATVLAAIGIYGVMACVVTNRTTEIGIRMALGASPQRVRRSMLSQAVRYVSAGFVIGIPSAAALATLVERLLYRVSSRDAPSYVLAAAFILGASLLAAWVPARRAASVDPLRAIRCD